MPSRSDLGLLLVRVLAGGMLAMLHGWGKAKSAYALLVHEQEWRFVQTVAGLGFPFPLVFALAAAVAEFVGGLLLAIGFHRDHYARGRVSASDDGLAVRAGDAVSSDRAAFFARRARPMGFRYSCAASPPMSAMARRPESGRGREDSVGSASGETAARFSSSEWR